MSATTSTTIAIVMGASERVTAAITGWWSAIVQGTARATARRRDVGHPLLLRTAWALVALLALGLPSRVDAQTSETPNFTIEYHHADLSGNIRLTTDEYGAVVREAIHLPFGERDTGECGTPEDGARPLGSQGKPRDPKTCVDDFGARDYRAAIGRFQTVDPVLPVDRALRDPQPWNRYAYARNNPLIYSDPDGRIIVPILSGGVTGAAFDAGMHALSNVCNGRAWHEGTGEAALRSTAMGAVTGVAGQLILGARAAPVLTKIVAGASSKAAGCGAAAVQLGQAGEAAVRAAFDIGPAKRVLVNGVEKISDGLTGRVLSEIENVGSLSYTQQLRDFATFAQQTGRQCHPYGRPDTQLSGPLLDAINAGQISLRFIPDL